MINKRKGKMYVDFLQNRPKATLASPYSVRPKPGATVSDIFKALLSKGVDIAPPTLTAAEDPWDFAV